MLLSCVLVVCIAVVGTCSASSFEDFNKLRQAFIQYKGDYKMMILSDKSYFDMFVRKGLKEAVNEYLIDGLINNAGSLYSHINEVEEVWEYFAEYFHDALEYQRLYPLRLAPVVSLFDEYLFGIGESCSKCINGLVFAGLLSADNTRYEVEYKVFVLACNAYGDLVVDLYVQHLKDMNSELLAALISVGRTAK